MSLELHSWTTRGTDSSFDAWSLILSGAGDETEDHLLTECSVNANHLFRQMVKADNWKQATNEGNLGDLGHAVSLESMENPMKQHLKRSSAHHNP